MSFNEKMEKWKGLALPASIIINVFLIGFIVARVSVPEPPTPPTEVAVDFRTLPKSISREVREDIEHEMHMRRAEMEAAYEEMNRATEEINRLVSEQDFEEGELEAAFAKLHEIEAKIKGPMQRAFINSVRRMDNEHRQQVIEHRREMRRNSLKRKEQVDGKRWEFKFDNENFELDLNGLKKLEGLGVLEGLKNLEQIGGEDFEIVISSDEGENGRSSTKVLVIGKNDPDAELEFIEKYEIEKVIELEETEPEGNN